MASRELARRKTARKEEAKRKHEDARRRAFENEAWNARHPQECPICLDRPMTNLVWNCGLEDQPPYHRYHGYCDECADEVVESQRCYMCREPVQGHWRVGTAYFAFGA